MEKNVSQKIKSERKKDCKNQQAVKAFLTFWWK